MKFMKAGTPYYGECEKHPKYTGIRKPRGTCEACWRIYIRATGG